MAIACGVAGVRMSRVILSVLFYESFEVASAYQFFDLIL